MEQMHWQPATLVAALGLPDEAFRAFAASYNAEWLIEKNGYRSPLDAHAARLDTAFRRAA